MPEPKGFWKLPKIFLPFKKNYYICHMKVEIIKVAPPASLRNNTKYKFRGGKTSHVDARLLIDKKTTSTTVQITAKERLGREGFMTVEDYEAKRFNLYGLQEYFDANPVAQIDSLQATNTALQDELVQRDKEIMELRAKAAQLAAEAKAEKDRLADEKREKSEAELKDAAEKSVPNPTAPEKKKSEPKEKPQ